MFDKIPEEFIPVFTDYVKVLIPSLITYFVTRYTLSRPRKYEIREKQFNLVYLPIYLLTKQLIATGNVNQNIDLYFRKIDKIIYKNYQYVFPKTIKLFDKLKYEYGKESQNNYHLNNYIYQIESDYEKLKRELGYPTSSVFEFFKRLSRFNKILYITLALFFCATIYCAVNAILLFIEGDILNSVSAFGIGCILFLTIFIISYPMRH